MPFTGGWVLDLAEVVGIEVLYCAGVVVGYVGLWSYMCKVQQWINLWDRLMGDIKCFLGWRRK